MDEDKQALLDLHNDYRSQTALGNTLSYVDIFHPPATNMQKMVGMKTLLKVLGYTLLNVFRKMVAVFLVKINPYLFNDR